MAHPSLSRLLARDDFPAVDSLTGRLERHASWMEARARERKQTRRLEKAPRKLR